MQMGNTSSWMYFGAGLEEVTVTDGQMRLAAVCNDSHGAQSKRNVLIRMRSTTSSDGLTFLILKFY